MHPSKSAISVYALSGLVVASCWIEGFVPLPNIQFSGMGVTASDMAGTPSPSQPGHPENISGRILIANGRAKVCMNSISRSPAQSTGPATP